MANTIVDHGACGSWRIQSPPFQNWIVKREAFLQSRYREVNSPPARVKLTNQCHWKGQEIVLCTRRDCPVLQFHCGGHEPHHCKAIFLALHHLRSELYLLYLLDSAILLQWSLKDSNYQAHFTAAFNLLLPYFHLIIIWDLDPCSQLFPSWLSNLSIQLIMNSLNIYYQFMLFRVLFPLVRFSKSPQPKYLI